MCTFELNWKLDQTGKTSFGIIIFIYPLLDDVFVKDAIVICFFADGKFNVGIPIHVRYRHSLPDGITYQHAFCSIFSPSHFLVVQYMGWLTLFVAILVLIIGGLIMQSAKERSVMEPYEPVAEKNRHEKQLTAIRPYPIHFGEHQEIIDFVFFIQDLYAYNPPAFEEMIENLTAFFSIKKDMEAGVWNPSYYYQIAESKKDNAQNSLHSVIHALPNDPGLTDKFNRSHYQLGVLLAKHLGDMYNICKQRVVTYGLNKWVAPIEKGPKAWNTYHDDRFQFY